MPEGVTSIGDHAFSNCQSLTSITIPEGVLSIGDYTFASCSSLTSMTIPNTVVSIDDYAFQYCSSLNSIVLSNSLTSIGVCAFRGCRSLFRVLIPESVTVIKDQAFINCSNLNFVTCMATTPPALGSAVFNVTPSAKILYVPKGTVGDYEASRWSECFNTIREISEEASIEEVSISDEKPQIVINGNSIEIQNFNDAETISIFTTDGACVYQGKNHSVSLAPNKVYILHTARGILKFAL